MANIILFDSDARGHLQPLTSTRPMGELRLGILTLREKWERRLRGTASYITQEYLQTKYPIHIEGENFIINSGVLPNDHLCRKIDELRPSEALIRNGELIAARLSEGQFEQLLDDEEVHALQGTELSADIPTVTISRLWDLTKLNASAIADDYRMLCSGRKSQALPESNRVIGPLENIFLEEGAQIECCILNATAGPIYIGKNAEIMEGCMLRGPVAIGSDVVIKMGAKIYGPTTIGPGCKVGGEVTRSIFIGHSNKAHDGYLGDSVIGEWCNLGADTNNSNLKNNYSEVKLWDYTTERFERTGQQFVGLFMGDHSKCGINTMFNTGTVVGVFANVFGAGYMRNFIPDFSWGGADTNYRTYKLEEACETAKAVLQRRGISFTDLDLAVLRQVFERTRPYRSWDRS